MLDAVQLRAINNWYAETEKHLQIGEEPPIDSLKKGFKYSILYSARDPICRAIMAQDPKLLLPNSEKLRSEIVRMNDEGFTRLFEELRKQRIIRVDIALTDILTIWRITRRLPDPHSYGRVLVGLREPDFGGFDRLCAGDSARGIADQGRLMHRSQGVNQASMPPSIRTTSPVM